MTKVVLVHGIAQQYVGSESLRAQCAPALIDGATLAGSHLATSEISMAFYGDLFRPASSRAFGTPDYDYTDVTDPLEQELLHLWWQAVVRDTPTRARTPKWIQRAVYGLCSHTGVSEHVLIGDLKQVKGYFTDEVIRRNVRRRVADQITQDTKILVGHSLGSVVAYEVLCAAVESPVTTFVTLGSPLGIPRVIFDRLDPSPHQGRACWPRSLDQWTNIADQGDIIPLVKSLAPLFEGHISDVIIHNGAKTHDIRRYLTARETGLAIKAGLL